MVARIDKKFSCWNCDAFQYTNPGQGLTGECRKLAPRCLCSRLEATVTPPSGPPVSVNVENEGGPAVWPVVQDGPRTWCLDWTLSTDAVPAPPIIP